MHLDQEKVILTVAAQTAVNRMVDQDQDIAATLTDPVRTNHKADIIADVVQTTSHH